MVFVMIVSCMRQYGAMQNDATLPGKQGGSRVMFT